MADGRVRIRSAADLGRLAVVEALMAQELEGWYESWRGEDFFRSRFPGEADLMLVAEHEGCVLGGILAHAEQSGASVDGIAVVPSFRRQGLGRALLSSLEAQAAMRDLEEIVLGAGDDAVGFYRRCAYEASLLIQFAPTGDPESLISDLLAGPLVGRRARRSTFLDSAQLIVDAEADDDIRALVRERAPNAHMSFLLRKRLPRTRAAHSHTPTPGSGAETCIE